MERATFLARKGNAKTETATLADGQTVKIRKMTQAEVEHAGTHYGTPEKGVASLRYVVSKCALNDDGTQMFTADDLPMLEAMDYDDVNRIAAAAGKFSGTIQTA